MRFKERQLSQMANHEISVDVEHDKHDLSKNEASKEDKLKPGRLLTAPEMTRYRGGFGGHCCPQLSLGLLEMRRRQNNATNQCMVKIEQHDMISEVD